MPDGIDIVGSGFTFPLTLVGGGVALTHDHDQEIVQAIVIILSTPVGSRLMRPEFGCRIHELLFAPMNISTFMTAQRYVEDALGYWEPRIDVLDIQVEPDRDIEGCMRINISYRIRATHDERALVYPFYSIPDEG
jgi:uncharacterized protein